MIEFRGYATMKGNAAVSLSNALIEAARHEAFERGKIEGRQEGYAEGMRDVRANQWRYIERLAHEFAIGVRS